MSEVKPTLSHFDIRNPPINSWLSAFPTGKWIDAQSRNWYWIIINVVSFTNAYEYRIKFDTSTENMTLIFPYVVKTSDKEVKKVFIDGVEYQVRSKTNYGNRFVVSGREFSFKVATKHKLDKQTVPFLTFEYKQALFKSVKFLNSEYIRLRYSSFNFNVVNTTSLNYIAIRNNHPTFSVVSLTTCYYKAIRNTLSVFNNINSVSVPVIANCRDTSWQRFGGVWSSCDTWMPST